MDRVAAGLAATRALLGVYMLPLGPDGVLVLTRDQDRDVGSPVISGLQAHAGWRATRRVALGAEGVLYVR
jgi:hypothetical protein